MSLVLPEKSMDKIWSEQILHVQTAKSCPVEARVVPKEMLIVKDTAALKNGDEVVTSSQIVKVKITKNVPKSFVTIVTFFP